MSGKKLLNRLCSLALALCLVSALIPWDTAAAAAGSNTLQSSMEYLVNQCGQRLYGTPNEEKAAAYIKAQYEKFGYKNVEWAKINQPSTGYTGRLVFKDGSADILGNPFPSAPAKGEFDKMHGTLVDLGTDTEYAVPEGITGDIIGAVKFETGSTIAAAKINEIIQTIQTENKNINLTGLLVTRTGAVTFPSTTPVLNPVIDLPCIITTEMFWQTAVDNAADFDYMERYTRTQTNAVIATKPASSKDPDAIILVTSHLDSVAASPGASDNASGVAANLELARRFANADIGNIEVRFAAVGAEEGGGMLGSVYLRDSLTEAQKAISINMNMDMLCSNSKTSSGKTLNAVSIDINPKPLQFNLPAYLITNTASSVQPWADGIENVRIYNYGSSDHVKFSDAGIDAGSMIVATDTDDDIEYEDHKSLDNLKDNYSYERLAMCTDLMANGIQKAADLKLSKRARISFKDMGSYNRATLSNADQLFRLYTKVTAVLTSEDNEGSYRVTFTKDKPYVNGLPAYDTFAVSDVVAYGSGNADNKNAARNDEYKNFQTKLVASSSVTQDFKVSTEVTRGGKPLGSGTYEKGQNAQVKGIPSSGYRFVGWYDKNSGKKLSASWKYSFKVTNNVHLVGKFAKIAQAKAAVKRTKGKALKISWKKASGTFRYQIYRAVSKKGSYKRIASVSSSKSSFTDKKVKKGKRYYYKVRIVCKADICTYGKFSKVKSIKTKR